MSNNNNDDLIISTLNALRTEVFGMRAQLSEQKSQVETLLRNQLLPISNNEATTYKNLPLNGYLDADVKSRILSNPDRLGYRNIPSIPKTLENKIANNNSNSNNKEKEKTPAINVRLDALIQELHLRKNGENAGELSEEALHRAKAPLKKLAADVCQLIRGNDSNELLSWKQLGSTNRLFYSLVFEDIAAAHVELGNLYQCCERWGANGFLSLAFKAVKQKHKRKEERNRTRINSNAAFGNGAVDNSSHYISSSESNHFEDDDEPMMPEVSSEEDSLPFEDGILSRSRAAAGAGGRSGGRSGGRYSRSRSPNPSQTRSRRRR